MDQINVIVTCTKRKKANPVSNLHVRNFKRFNIETAFARWTREIIKTDVESFSARQLYSGDHWSIIRSLADASTCRNQKVNIWVCSAGYGIISLNTLIKPYSATFSSSHPDSVSNWSDNSSNTINARLWWQLLTKWTDMNHDGPRSVSDIARSYPGTPMIVAASQVYLSAIADDLVEGAQYLDDPELLSIVSAGSGRSKILPSNLLPCDARLQHVVGGPLLSLNIRIVRKILERSDSESMRFSSIKRWLEILNARQPEIRRYQRIALTDQEVKRYILCQLEKNPRARRSSMLRQFRDSGRACEQSRFSALYTTVKEHNSL